MRQPKVLVVDDDQALLEMYTMRLKEEAFEVIVARNGEEALARAVDSKPDVILLDVMMPKVTGFDVLDILKSTPETKHIPVLILTVLIQDADRERGLKAGAEDYLVKSETMPGQVIEKVKQVLSKNQPFNDGRQTRERDGNDSFSRRRSDAFGNVRGAPQS